MTRGEAISRALFWAAFGTQPDAVIEDLHGWIVGDRYAAPFVVTTSATTITIESDKVYAVIRRRHEKTKVKAMVYDALKLWAERNDAIAYFPTMRQMYRDELARLLETP